MPTPFTCTTADRTRVTTLQDAALAAHDAGLSVLPAATNGSKMPPFKTWKSYQETRATRDRLIGMLEQVDGFGAICGAVSGGLVMLELEGRSIHLLPEIDKAAEASGLKPVFDRVRLGYTEQTPSGGVHWLLRCPDDPAGNRNMKLARNAAGECLAETKGEGGWVVLAPSGGRTHDTGKPWTLALGGFDTIATVTPAERDDLLDLFRTFDSYRPAEPIPHRNSEILDRGEVSKPDPFGPVTHTNAAPSYGLSPGDDYAEKHDWRQILEPHGWTYLFDTGGEGRWRRPGKTTGISATTGHSTDGVERLYVFSTSAAPFETERPYSKFAAYTTLEHGGDYSAAARALSQAGYGQQRDSYVEAATRITDDATRHMSDGSVEDGATEAQPVSMFDALVNGETLKMRVKDAANRAIRLERAGTLPAPIIVDLPDLLAQPDEDTHYLVDQVWPAGGRFLLAAQYKAGKTTLIANLLRALADGDDFLDRYTVNAPSGRIVLIDDELDPRMLRRWLRDQGIVNAPKISVVALRGRLASFDILDPHGRTEWAARIAALGASVLIFDCLRPVLDALGLDEAREAGRFLVAFDELCGEAGVTEAGVVHHAGHSGERSRGDSRLRDWPDVEWLLVRDKGDGDEATPSARRYFSAYGRDVDVHEAGLDFDPITRRLKLTEGNRAAAKIDRDIPALLEWLAEHPGAGTREIKYSKAGDASTERLMTALNRAKATGHIQTVPGTKNAIHHYVRAVTE